MSDAAGSALIGAIFGGIKGGADANLDTIKQEAEQERKMSYAKLMQQYAQDNTMLQDRLATARQEKQFEHADKTAEKALIADLQNKQITETNTNAQNDKLYALKVAEMEQAAQLAREAQAGLNTRNSEEKNKPGELGRMYDDLLRINNGDVEKTQKQFDAYAASKTTGSSKGALTKDQEIKLDGELQEEWKASKQPGQPFEAWALLNRPKAAAALGITSADSTKNEIDKLKGQGIVESEMSDDEIGNRARAGQDNYNKKEASKWKPSSQTTSGIVASQSNTETPLTREQAVMAQNIAAEKNITFKEAVNLLLEKISQANEESRQKGGQGITQTR